MFVKLIPRYYKYFFLNFNFQMIIVSTQIFLYINFVSYILAKITY